MADRIQSCPAQTPLYICGRYGAIVLETGQRLLEQSVEVGGLIVFDSTAPSISGHDGRSKNSVRLLLKPVRAVLRVPDNIGLSDWLARRSTAEVSRKKSANPFREMNKRLKQDYRPSCFNGRVILIRSEQFAGKESKAKQLERWRQITDNLETFTVPGTHKTMFNMPNVRQLGALIQDILDGRAPETSEQDQLLGKSASDVLRATRV
ncbi:hypothetical protein N9H39_07380 [Gammaproteobacteria bacterium]|nr:hypothetical protein [Gammaproteobacteria bacterium]